MGNASLIDFSLLIVPYHAAKSEKNSQSRSWDYSWYKIAYLAQKRTFRWFYWNHFSPLIKSYHAAKFENNPWSRSWDIRFHNLGQQLGQNYPIGPKKWFLKKIHLSHFLSTYCVLSCCKVWKRSTIYCNLWPQSSQNCPFSPKENFLENFT